MSTDGEKYVQVDEDALNTSDGASIANVIREIIKSKFSNLILANGQLTRVNSGTNKEFRGSDWALGLLKTDPESYSDKLKTIANADEILITAKNWVNEELKHERTDGITSFAKAQVRYKVGERGYIADVLVGVKDDGSAILRDIVDIKRKKITDATSEAGEKHPHPVLTHLQIKVYHADRQKVKIIFPSSSSIRMTATRKATIDRLCGKAKYTISRAYERAWKRSSRSTTAGIR